ncbi:MAG TPA: pyridoxal-phosphate dependent enzyme [Candidatus Polarisedimenticolia bacterium]
MATRGRFDPRAIATRPLTIWRYHEAIGIGRTLDPVTLGEGFTPIVSREICGLPSLFKLEFLMPTGSFKDRGASVVMSHLAAHGVARAVEDSSGNAGVAMAAYGTRAGISVEILVPDDAPRPKLAAIEVCGGRLIRMPSGRGGASAEALRRAESGIPFASHVWNPFFQEGIRTFAFEVWEQMEGRVPARVFVPVGNGSLLIGAFDGFAQLREDGLATSVPRMMGIQAAACAPLAAPSPPGEADPRPAAATLADGIRIPAPPRARRAREAVERSGGAFMAVTEEEIAEAWGALGRAGLDVEPTAAVSFAGALKWSRSDPQAAEREIVETGPPLSALTGSGLKVLR